MSESADSGSYKAGDLHKCGCAINLKDGDKKERERGGNVYLT